MNIRYAIRACLALGMLLCSITGAWAQSGTVSGTVKDGETGQGLASVNVAVIGKVIGTLTDAQGNFKLNVTGPVRLRISYVGYAAQEVDATPGTPVNVTLNVSDVQANEVVVSASRVAETVLQAPVTIEKMDAVAIQNSGSVNYYQGLQNLKGVDMATSSIGFQIVNARGFNSTGNTRMIQLIDGMDVQAPVLNFPVGNINGPSELDVQSVEFVPGASSALYGPQAFSGALVITSKDPFIHQGLSAFTKVGLHQTVEGGPQLPIYEGSIRYAKAFNDRFAFKVNVSYFTAQDWQGNQFDLNRRDRGIDLFGGGAQGRPDYNIRGLANNPAYNGVHTLGDESNNNLRLLASNPTYLSGAGAGLGANAQLGALFNGLATSLFPTAGSLAQQQAALVNLLTPDQFVTRTGFWEGHLVDYRAKNFKVSPAIHWRVSDNVELIAQYNGGWGTSVYTGAQRYSLRDFSIQQFKLEARGSNFFLRGYYTLENSGDSYIANAVGSFINESWYPSSYPTGVTSFPSGMLTPSATRPGWLPQYNTTYIATLLGGLAQATGNNAAAIANFLQNQNTIPAAVYQAAHAAARSAADAGQPQPGSPLFNELRDRIRSTNLSQSNFERRGARFDDASAILHFDGQYDFKNQIDWMELQLGGSYREYLMNTNGTILDDANRDIQFNEWGVYLQAGKRLFDNKLRLTASVRYDKNQNFDGQFNPRFAAQWEVAKNHYIRGSYQTGFRFPTTQGQYINLDVTTERLLGGLSEITIDRYRLNSNTYTEASVDAARAFVLSQPGGYASLTNPTILNQARGLLVAYNAEPVRPEQVQAIEFGYKGLIGEKLFIDLAYYYNNYTDFIAQVYVRRTPFNPFGTGTVSGLPESIVGLQTLLASPRLSNSTMAGPHATPTQASVFFPYTNSNEEVQAHGAVIGLEYSLPSNFYVNGNYNWNKLITEVRPEVAQIYSFNTPEHKANITIGNKRVMKNGAFAVTWRWQDAFLWESSFAIGTVPAVQTVDAQLSYRLPQAKTIVKVGAQNALNNRNFLNYGGPELGAIYYVQLTFDTGMTN